MEANRVSIILPCLNEGASIAALARRLVDQYPDAEIIVVDDGSEPRVRLDPPVTVLRHPYRIGNGAAVKTGVRYAGGQVLVFMDADGQHDPADISRLLDKIEAGYDLAVGARDYRGQASFGRSVANRLYNRFRITHDRVQDPGPDLGLPGSTRRAVQRLPVSAPERVFLPHDEHHGVLPLRLLRRLRAHPGVAANRKEQDQAVPGRHSVPRNHPANRIAVLADALLPADQYRAVSGRFVLVRVHVHYGTPVHQPGCRAVSRFRGHGGPGVTFRADIGSPLPLFGGISAGCVGYSGGATCSSPL